MPKLFRGISENGGVIFYGIDSTEIVKKAENIHKTSAVITAALGRLLTGAVLMSSTLKSSSDSLTLRVQADGPAGVLLAVANGAGEVKGYVQNTVVEVQNKDNGKLNVGAAVGKKGTLSVIKDLGLKTPYVGQVPLVSGEIAEDITSYYAISEQTPTICALGVLVDKDLSVISAGGYLLQLLPGATSEEIQRLEDNLAIMPPVTQLFADKKTPWQICKSLLNGFNPNELDEQDADYICDCSMDRVERAIISLGVNELENMKKENNSTEIACHFCAKKYEIKLDALLNSLNN